MKKLALLLICAALILSACTNSQTKNNLSTEIKSSNVVKPESSTLDGLKYNELNKKIESSVISMIKTNKFKNKSLAIGRVSNESGAITDLSITISDILEKSFAKTSESNFKTVDRTHIQEILEEWKLSMSGMIEEDSSAQTARLLGIDIFIFSRYQITGTLLSLNIKAVDSKTSEITSLENITIDLNKNISPPIFLTDSSIDEEKTTLPLTLWTSKKSYKIGESVNIFAKSKEDCYLTVLDISPSGEVSVIFPNSFSNGNFLKAEQTYQIPGDSSLFTIEATAPKGMEIIRAITTKEPILDIAQFVKNYTTDNPFGELKSDFSELSRGLIVKSKNSKPGTWNESTIKFKIY